MTKVFFKEIYHVHIGFSFEEMKQVIHVGFQDIQNSCIYIHEISSTSERHYYCLIYLLHEHCIKVTLIIMLSLGSIETEHVISEAVL